MCQHFYKLKNQLHLVDEMLLYDFRLIIPTDMQGQMVNWLHESHLGIEKTLARARELFYWPGMNKMIKDRVQSCIVCEKFTRNVQKEPLTQERAKYPYHIVGMDIFEYGGRSFIAIYDSYSNYLVAIELKNKSASHVIEAVTAVFVKVGFPTIIRCDNVPFNSRQFHEFALQYNIKFQFSSPRYPQSNGLSEKAIGISKNILMRLYEAYDVQSYQYHILEYNTTPVAGMKLAPSELFFGRQIKTRIPISDTRLVRNSIAEEHVEQTINQKKERQAYYFNRTAKKQPKLKSGDLVIFKKDSKQWHYGTVVGIVNDSSYIIRDMMGKFFRRNRRHLAKTRNQDFDSSELMLEDETLTTEKMPKQAIVVPPLDLGRNIHDDVHANESFDSFHSLPSDEELDWPNETGHDSDSEVHQPLIEPSPPVVTTRSGRVVRPPKRYGFEE